MSRHATPQSELEAQHERDSKLHDYRIKQDFSKVLAELDKLTIETQLHLLKFFVVPNLISHFCDAHITESQFKWHVEKLAERYARFGPSEDQNND